MGPSRIAVIAAVASAPFLAACGGGDWVESSGAALGESVPTGTFENSMAPVGAPSRVVLMSDGTVHLEKTLACRLLSCQSVKFDGFYKRFGTGSKGHLDFVTPDGIPFGSYDYLYDGESLDLIDEGMQGQLLPRAVTGWCSISRQCDLQHMATPQCVGAWSCVSDGCQYSCGGM